MSTSYSTRLFWTTAWTVYGTGDVYYSYKDRDNFRTLRMDESKVSVDSGAFVPGEYRVNPYSVSREWYDTPSQEVTAVSHQYTELYGQTQYVSARGELSGAHLTSARNQVLAIPPDVGNLDEQALAAAYAKVGQQRIGCGESLGEIRETIRTLRHPFKGLRDFLYSTNYYKLGLLNKVLHYQKSGRWLGKKTLTGRDAAKAAADAWLELRYGIRPLVYMTQDVIELVKTGLLPFNGLIRTSRSYKNREATRGVGPYLGSAGAEFHSSGVLTDKVACNASVQYRQVADRPVSEVLGLAPQYLPELAWELTHLSFVVDWWFDVGTWLKTLRLNPSFEVLGNTVGTKIERNVTLHAKYRYPNSGEPLEPFGYFGAWGQEKYTRVVNQHLPNFPLLTLHFPGLAESADYVALILQPVLNNIKR